MADDHQLSQVFLNILTNAEQAMAEGHGGVKLSILARRVDRNVRLSFTDDGPGMPKDILKKIFDPLFTTKGVGEGSGLGLSISYDIILEHGGELWSESEPGNGAAIHLELPGLTKP